MKLASIVVVVLICLGGWVGNIVKLINNNDFASPYKTEAIRAVGVFVAPVGVITGYMDLEGED